MGGVAYETDILDDFAAQRRGPSYPDVVVEMGMVVEDRASHSAVTSSAGTPRP